MGQIARLLAVCTTVATAAGADDYVRLTASDSGNNSSFTQLSRWSDKQLPHADADYIVTNNFLLRGPVAGNKNSTANHVFGGRSLTLGTLSSPGSFGIRTRDTEKTTVDDLILVNGQLRQLVDDQDSRLYGAITVQSPASAPFCVQSSEGRSRTIRFVSTISGAEGTALLFTSDGAAAHNTNWLYGANEAYLGTITVGGGEGNALIVNHRRGAGGDPSVYTPKGVVVKDGAMLRFNAEPITYTNRGLYVEASGGTLRQVVNSIHLRMPLAGEGTLVKTGPMQTTFSNTWTGVTVDVREGNFVLETGCPTPGEGAAVVVSGGLFGLKDGIAPNLPVTMTDGVISPCSLSTGDLVLSNATVTGGGLRVDFDEGRYDTLFLQGNSTFAPSSFLVDVASLTSPMSAARYPILVVPESVGALTAEMITFTGLEKDEYGYPPALKAEVETADGVQTLYLSRTNGVVRLVTNQSSKGKWTTASAWSDGVGLRAGVDFLIDAEDCPENDEYFGARTTEGTEEEVFAGRSLTAYGTTAKTARVLIKCGGLACDDIRLGRNGWVCGSGSGGNSGNQYVTGTVTVAAGATRTRPAMFATTSGRTFEVRAELKGDGMVGVTATAVNGAGTVLFTRPNPEFQGTFLVKTNYTNKNEIAKGTVRMQVTCEECLGAAPAKLATNCVEVWEGAWFEAPCDLTLDDPTRGLTFQGGSSVSAASGSVFTIKTPISTLGTLNKRGAGTVVFDSDYVASTALNPGIRVLDGCVQVNRADTFWDFYRIRFASGDAAIAFPGEPVNDDIGTYGIAMWRTGPGDMPPFLENDRDNPYLPVRIDFGDAPPSGTRRIALCSVAPAAAEQLRGHVDVRTKVDGFTCTVEEDAVTYKGTALTRFTAVFRPSGACIIFR